MRSRRNRDRHVLAGALVAIAAAVSPDPAAAGEFAVGSCKADQLNYSTRAFQELATRGMSIRRACDPEGPGLRGLITRNVIRKGRVPRNSLALVVIEAPPGTRFTRFRWAGELRRTDCRYALQMWADAPDLGRIPIKNVRANQGCPRPRRVQSSGYTSENFVVTNATRIVQRVICIGRDRREFCSARGSNYILTDEAEVGIADVLPPSVSILGDTPLARGEWVSGTQPLNYDASDNVGVRSAKALASGADGGTEHRQCAFATPEKSFAAQIPCPNGPGQISVNTDHLSEGTQALAVRAQDTAGNVADSAPVAARIDRSPPDRVDVEVHGGQAWRNTSDFALTWSNPPEVDRAPIVAARYKLCQTPTGECNTGEQQADGISNLSLEVPVPGEWTLSLWRRDAAGNASETAASVPVKLRYDPESPQLGFEPPSADDPTLVSVSVTDQISGLAGGVIEISQLGSGIWQTLATEQQGSRLVARVDDAALPAGGYQFRARAYDFAGNEGSTERRLDGQPMAVTLPLRIAVSMRAGFQRVRTVRRKIRLHGRTRVVRRRVTVLEPAARVRFGGHALISGRLINRDGQGIAGADVRVLSASSTSPEQLIALVQTDSRGYFRYRAAGSTSRTLRFAYPGSPLVLPAARAIDMTVPAVTSLHVNRSRVLNGQSVTFSGRLRTQPAPAGGKLIELQVRLSDRWQTFRTSRTDGDGRWSIRYRFKRTRGVQRFHFRVRLPHEATYPFAAGSSRRVSVRVKGL